MANFGPATDFLVSVKKAKNSAEHFEKAEFLKRNVSEKYRAVLTAQVIH